MNNNSLVKKLQVTVIYREWEPINDGHETTIREERVKTFPTKNEALKSVNAFIEDKPANCPWIHRTAYIIPEANGEETADFAIGDRYYS